MTSKREKFFRRRVLNKLFPREDESETDSDASDQERTTLRSTEREEFKELPAEGRKRKLSESKGRGRARYFCVRGGAKFFTSHFPAGGRQANVYGTFRETIRFFRTTKPCEEQVHQPGLRCTVGVWRRDHAKNRVRIRRFKQERVETDQKPEEKDEEKAS
ncbi:uncharacterized protein [Montipora capricornis]|uniref:uncharacterized protein isoform X2 n=1 Tax=Montipora foliosa TaxID=591990 RepID=UPI0035F15C7D